MLTALAVVAISLPMAPAWAQNGESPFASLFGGFGRPQPLALPPQVSSYADPNASPEGEAPKPRSAATGGGVVYCVRLCDGRYFPMQRRSEMKPQELCSAFCPAARTKVYSGSAIDHAVASDGTRYASLENAFVFREQIVSDCSCNGKDPVGLAPIEAEKDPTLRSGDIVATTDGMMAYAGTSRSKKGDTASFTPIDSSRVAADVRRKLSDVKVTPAPARDAVAKPDSKPQTSGKAARDDRRRVQLSR